MTSNLFDLFMCFKKKNGHHIFSWIQAKIRVKYSTEQTHTRAGDKPTYPTPLCEDPVLLTGLEQEPKSSGHKSEKKRNTQYSVNIFQVS
ncbi:hypothetical protein GDO81_011161 [Engystomops pustulosus]|uniref:Uncharacterized protein n=1 Tax=Engystomops pustulosus TaxID=76066 RepID=A0AAV7BCE7_ENGPU|nr:hypothetical protein GDO81_011161 [Engystomops pustulosus]